MLLDERKIALFIKISLSIAKILVDDGRILTLSGGIL